MATRTTPYGAFNFIVNFDGGEIFGGFSDVSGIGTEITVAEYRYGNDKENHVRKVGGVHKVSDITLKRGILNSKSLFDWIGAARTTGPAAQKSVTVTLLDESHKPVQSWVLRGVIPMKYTGPTLAAKGGGDVAMEEVVLSAEAMELSVCLVFEVAAPPAAPDANRADVACFVGYVARRAGRPLPAPMRAQLDAAGWVNGLWRKPAEQVESLLNLPLVIDSWHLFDRLYAWDRRPLKADGDAVCTSYLGAAVRSFFARGGRRAIVIRVGDPWPYIEDAALRSDPLRLRQRLRLLLPDFAQLSSPGTPFQPHDPASWQGIQHLVGLRETSLLLLPDLPDACAFAPPAVDPGIPLAPIPEGFVECSTDEPVSVDTSLRELSAPRLDSAGYLAWQQAVSAARAFLAQRLRQREVLLVAALPLPQVATQRVGGDGHVYAQGDMLAYLQRIGVLRIDGSAADAGTASAFVQLGWPWLRTQAADLDLPQGLEPPDGVIAGLVAAGATQRGCFRSIAGDWSMPYLRDVADAEPVPAWGAGDDSPDSRMARHVCTIAPSPDGWALQSDVTTSPDEAWRFGGASRLMSTIVRAVRSAGDAVAFDSNGPLLWAQLRRGVEAVLTGYWLEGAFAGDTAAQAFDVRCDRSTMTPNDIDAGRLIVAVTVRPAVSIERITVVLNLGNAAAAATLREAA
jgi:phage tail-like protein